MEFSDYIGANKVVDSTQNVEYHAIRSTLVKTCDDPQIWEVHTQEGIVLYIRYVNEFKIHNKSKGTLLFIGSPVFNKNTKLDLGQVEFYTEMYSNMKIKFI